MTLRIKKSSLLLTFFLSITFIGFLLLTNILAGHFSIGSSQKTNLLTIFFTGLLAGGLSCMAVQGGLLAATIAQREEERLKNKMKQGAALPIFSFLIAKLIAYTLLGALLGWFGSIFKLSLPVQVAMQFAVAIFMLGTALNILNVHPIFRYFIIQPPRFLTRLVRKQSKSSDLFAPVLLGSLTILIPCGTTQAFMALSIASGNPSIGAAILFAFVLGTSPVFFLLGYFTTKLGDSLQQKFMRFAAYAIILLTFYNANNALALTGTNFTLQNLVSTAWCTLSVCDTAIAASLPEPNNSPNVEITANGYNPNNLYVKAGSKVTIHLKNTNGQGCTQTFTIPSLGVQKSVPVGQSDTVAFVAPSTPGPIHFMCSMGMYQGNMFVEPS